MFIHVSFYIVWFSTTTKHHNVRKTSICIWIWQVMLICNRIINCPLQLLMLYTCNKYEDTPGQVNINLNRTEQNRETLNETTKLQHFFSSQITQNHGNSNWNPLWKLRYHNNKSIEITLVILIKHSSEQYFYRFLHDNIFEDSFMTN